MSSHTGSFVSLSAQLTGFPPVVLRGTGMVDTYLETLRSCIPENVVERLLALPDEAADAGGTALADALADPDLGPVARNVIMLWYCGTWTRLADDWRARNGAREADATRVVSSAAYQAGLQWSTVGAHPAGARQQGYGSWSLAPVGAAG